MLSVLLTLFACGPEKTGDSAPGETGGIVADSADSVADTASDTAADTSGDTALDGETGDSAPTVDADEDGVPAALDCDDDDATVHPGAVEACDGLDNDCDGATDGALAVDATAWFADLDQDTYGDAVALLMDCIAPENHVSDATDCDDTRAAVNPGSAEVCDDLGLDEDCDTLVNDEDDSVTGTSTSYADTDGDGYGDDTTAFASCVAPANTSAVPGDCDDTSADYNPGAAESCEAPVDFNCDGSVGMVDADADLVAACLDCDDSDASVFPGGSEACNGKDDDCDGELDEAEAVDASTWYIDADADGWGSSSVTEVACDEPTGFDGDALDCDDTNSGIRPDAPEVWYDGIDQDCEGTDDDQDGDGFLRADDCDDTDAFAFPGATETRLDGIDQDCDGFDDGADSDGDGLYDTDETASDPYDDDTDDDGLLDGDEVTRGTDPSTADSDGDSLDDGDEVSLGTDPLATDTDGDSWADNDEVDGYTDPLDETDHPYTGGWEIGSCRDSIVATGAAVGDIADDFALTDQHGDTVHLHDFCNRAVLLDFTQFW